jgi:hypothetical protein
MHIDDLMHFPIQVLAPPKHNHFSTILRMIWIRDLYPMKMGVMKGI